MGTHGTVRFVDEKDNVYLVVYRQFDGYESFGPYFCEIVKKLPQKEITKTIVHKLNYNLCNIIINYINFGKVAHGIQCFAAQAIANEKTRVGSVYVEHPDIYGGEECNQEICNFDVKITPEKGATTVHFPDSYVTIGFVRGGKELEEKIRKFIKPFTVKNGVDEREVHSRYRWNDKLYKVADGIECFIAQFIKYFKTGPGDVYVVLPHVKYENHFVIKNNFEIKKIETT